MTLDWGQQSEGQGTLPACPWDEEVISEEEYQRSLESLRRFVAEVDVSRLYTLEDVSAVASLVGHDMRILAVIKGKKNERKSLRLEYGASELISRVEREYIFTTYLEDREIVVSASDGHSLISERRMVGFQRYQREELRVVLPSDRDIAFGTRPNVGEQSLYEIDLRGGGRRECHPVKDPQNAQTQQTFTGVLKDAIRDVLSIVR
ncbi:MAG TPA: hypothetical protein VF043_09110 [Ktedonobacteraceae bacterium]